jgi:glyoxylase-like metal-dependent hydrolase (beta-lactamase superfamily II)
MSQLSRRIALALAALAALASVAFAADHRFVLLRLAAVAMEVPELGPQTDEGLDAIWYDDYFTVFRIDPDTYAIGETRYHQANFNYLILGTSRAVLFDSGPGVRDLVPVIRSLTSLPVTSAASHLHYDHVGQYNDFDTSAMIDLPELRSRATAGRLALSDREHLGFFEKFPSPSLEIGEWWAPGQEIDLGGRRLIVHHTPGHTRDSMILEDPEREQFFTGDTYYPGELYLFLPNSSLGDFTRTTNYMLESVSETAVLYGAHRLDPAGLPSLERSDLLRLQEGLLDARNGTALIDGGFPQRFELNDYLALMMDFSWGRDWD